MPDCRKNQLGVPLLAFDEELDQGGIAFLDCPEGACPDSKVLEPVVIPHIERSQDPPAAAQEAVKTVRSAFGQALRGLPDRRTFMVSARLALLRRHLREALSDFLKHVEKHYYKLESAESDAARKVVAELVGTDSQLRSGVRKVDPEYGLDFAHTFSPGFHHVFHFRNSVIFTAALTAAS